ncbi:ribokinase [uncultured Paludibaculum sp.]|uniref:ribokinase n=1 Tax=uncultured Paludibaculum sp. TaxID=1765020 RepID=UPI002AAC3BEC|nr:ribokinase [uncultured Paludibaculum sp.]
MQHSSLVVVGSLNMDFVVQVDRLPAPGETTLGGNFQMIPGGKGANQACAAGKLARCGRVSMVGCVGLDPFADHLKASLAAAGVDVSTVRAARQTPTGVALIWVEKSGQNSIVVAPGANAMLAPGDIESARATFEGSRCALFQLETPLETVEAALRAARAAGALTILDPAPARPLPAELLSLVDVLTPNESEACILLGRDPSRVNVADAAEIARAVRGLGPKAVVLKLGDQGCFYSDGHLELAVAGFAVEAVDTTAAGDTFNAALAVALSEDVGIEDALRFANAAAALSVTRLGAQASAPSREDVDAFMARPVA